MIGVKYNGVGIVKGRYDGQNYEFKPGVTVALSEEAATHILGYGLQDKTNALLRLGWLANSAVYDDTVKKLDDFQFFSEARIEFNDPTAIRPPEKPEQHIPEFVAAAKK